VTQQLTQTDRHLMAAGKEIRKWRLLFDAVVREVLALRRSRRATHARSRERSARRHAQLARWRATSVDDMVARLEDALERSVSLQSHYARLLNMYDGGERLTFPDALAWLARLDYLEAQRAAATHDTTVEEPIHG
jgi:hypothetical protein